MSNNQIPIFAQYANSTLTWRAKQGEAVTAGQILAMNTREGEKGSAAVMAPAAGVLTKLANEAETLDKPIGYVTVDGAESTSVEIVD